MSTEGPTGIEVVRSGFVALVGRPNAGKSTLLNALIGTKVAIVSDKPQTTRHRLRGVYDAEDCQIVIVDTPGLHKPHDALGEELNRSALMALADVDVVAMLVDATKPVGRGDEWVARHVAAASGAKLLVITKADIGSAESVQAQIDASRRLVEFDDVVVLSALEEFNLAGFVESVKSFLPQGPRYFPRDMPTDQPLEVMLAEAIREKVLLNTREEVPHSVGVSIEDLEQNEATGTTKVYAVVYVERPSQQGILVGQGGATIKRIGTEARHDLERILGGKVWLDLVVKEKRDWRRDASQIKRFGYGAGL